jgi:hypothetical protein
MSAEIYILSGARAGEQIILDTTEFRVGSEPQCEIFFDPRQDPAARGRAALFRLMDDGWYLTCTGIGELFINQAAVSGPTRIRSGDVLRMSDEGPDLSFSIVSRETAATMAPAQIPSAFPAAGITPPAMVPVQAAAVASPAPVQPVAAPAYPAPAYPAPLQPAPAPLPAVLAPAPIAAGPGSPPTRGMRPVLWAGAIGGGLVMIVLAVCVGRYFVAPSTVEPPPATDVSKSAQLEATQKKIRDFKLEKEKRQKAQEELNRRREEEALKKHQAPTSPP